MSDEDCTAWVLSPPPPRGLGTAEIFVRVRLTAPAALRAQTAAQAQAAGDHVIGHADGPIVLAATLAGFRVLIPTLPDAVGRALTAALDTALSAPSAMRLGAYRFEFARRVYIAGILNITPDSFYARARHAGMDAALTRAEEIVREGGDLIEIGGETAQAGPRLSPSEEIARVVPVVEAVRHAMPCRWPSIPTNPR